VLTRQNRELEWLLNSLQETLQSLKAGLDEVSTLLAPSERPSTLVMSSLRSESLKGFVTRSGARIVKGDIKLRLASLHPPKNMTAYPVAISTEPQAPTILLNQLVSARTLMNACLDVVDITTWAGDAKDPNYIAGQLRLLDVNLQEAKSALKGGNALQLPWYKNEMDETVCRVAFCVAFCFANVQAFLPSLPPSVSLHFYISDAALVLEVRTLEPLVAGSDYQPGYTFRDRLGFALGTSKPPTHDEVDEVFTWRGQEVKVREKVRVESLDPNLMAALAKMNQLERTVALARRGLDTLMGRDE
jgi:Rogdi leucine zipper containing protein